MIVSYDDCCGNSRNRSVDADYAVVTWIGNDDANEIDVIGIESAFLI